MNLKKEQAVAKRELVATALREGKSNIWIKANLNCGSELIREVRISQQLPGFKKPKVLEFKKNKNNSSISERFVTEMNNLSKEIDEKFESYLDKSQQKYISLVDLESFKEGLFSSYEVEITYLNGTSEKYPFAGKQGIKDMIEDDFSILSLKDITNNMKSYKVYQTFVEEETFVKNNEEYSKLKLKALVPELSSYTMEESKEDVISKPKEDNLFQEDESSTRTGFLERFLKFIGL